MNTYDVFGSIKLLDNDTSLSIKGNIWNDFNKNASFEITEHFAENIRVYIDENNNGVFDNNEKNTVTDNLCSYEFSSLDPGEYKVGVELTYVWVMTSKN